jgi:hypothetical protein
VLTRVVPALGVPGVAAYDQATAAGFDQLNKAWASDVDRARVSVLLGILTPAQIAAAAGVGEQQAIAALGLAPFLPPGP